MGAYVAIRTAGKGPPVCMAHDLRRKMLQHQYSMPDCPNCSEYGIDWLTVNIVVEDETPDEYPTFRIVVEPED